MTQSIQAILTPLLMMSYVAGLRIANSSTNHAKSWFSFLYMLIIWIIYFLSISVSISYLFKFYSSVYFLCYLLELFVTFLSIVFGIYYNKKFRSCLKKLDIVDKTLLELGTVTNYNKLYTKTLWLILGWSIIVILMNCGTVLHLKIERDCDIVTIIFFVFSITYTCHVNFISDLIIANVLGYIGIKFDQVNEQLHNVMKNTHRIKQAWENSMIHQHMTSHYDYRHPRRFLKILSTKCIIWIVIHLHLELHKISQEVNLIFGTEMTFKMAEYFCWIISDLRIIFSIILIDNYIQSNKIICAILYSIWFFYNVCKFLLINYVCETVATKAKTTRVLINKLSYATYDVEVREIISQFSLQMTYVPLTFCGIGFFQFGFKFLHKFIMSIGTVLVIVIQTNVNK